jgi:hypothetical protein
MVKTEKTDTDGVLVVTCNSPNSHTLRNRSTVQVSHEVEHPFISKSYFNNPKEMKTFFSGKDLFSAFIIASSLVKIQKKKKKNNPGVLPQVSV